MQKILDGMSDAGSRLNDALSGLIHSLSSLPRDFEDWRPSDLFTVADTVARVGSVGGLVETLTALPQDRFSLVPSARLTALASVFANLVQSVERAQSQFGQIADWGGFQRFDPASGQVFAQNGNSISAKNAIDEIAGHVDNVLEAHIPIVATTQPRSVGTFVAAARELRKQASEAARLVSELGNQQAELSAKIASTVAEENKAHNSASEATRLLSDIEQSRKTIDESAAKVAALLASAETVASSAKDLSAEVEAYETEFKGFHAALDAREQALAQGNEKLARLLEAVQKNQSDIEAQKAQAAEMLGGATVAGLSSTYKTQGEAVDKQLCWARLAYYFAVAFMIVSVAFSLNVFGNFMPPIIPAEGQDAGPLAIRVFAAIGSRALVLLPSILLVAFASRRHTALFQLREEYSHKYNLAASVNGFKEQAPDYKQPIAAAVFLELLRNPASALSGDKAEAGNEIATRDLLPTVLNAVKQMREGKNEA